MMKYKLIIYTLILLSCAVAVYLLTNRGEITERDDIGSISTNVSIGSLESIKVYHDRIGGEDYTMEITGTMTSNHDFKDPKFIGNADIIEKGAFTLPYQKDESQPHNGIKQVSIIDVEIIDHGEDEITTKDENSVQCKVLERVVKIRYRLKMEYFDGYSKILKDFTSGTLSFKDVIYKNE